MKAITNTILIIEDDAGLIELLNEKIEGCGYQTACVLSAAKAFEWLKVHTAFLILLDYSLPDLNGKEFIAELKKKGHSVPPFILATGQGDERIAVDMMKLGARDYIIKDNHFLEMIPVVISKVYSVIENENKLKLTEKALSESYQFNKQIIDSAQEGIIVYDRNMKYQVWNPYMEKLSGIKTSDVLGKCVLEIFPFLIDTGLIDNIKNALQGEIKKDIEIHFDFPITGKTGWISDAISTLRNIDGEIVGAISSVRDITERKLVEDALRESEYHLRTIIENEPECIKIVDEKGRLIMMNPAGLAIIEADSLEQVVGYSVLNFIAPEYQADYEEMHKHVLAGESMQMEYEVIGLKGRRRWLETKAVPINDNGKVLHLAIARDITESKLAEDALQASEELYRNLVLMIPDGVYKSTVGGKFVDVNPAMIKLLGYENKEELMAIDIKSQLYFDISDRENNKLNNQNEEMSISRMKKKDGSGIWVEDHGWYITDENGNVISHEGVLRDITERKKTEKALQDSETNLKKVLIASSELIDVNSESPDYGKIADKVLEISGAKYVCFNIYDENGLELTTVALSGLKENILKAAYFLGFDVINKKWENDPKRTEKIKDKTITRFGSIHELSGSVIPKTVANLIEKTFNLGSVFIVNIIKNNKSLGDFTLIYSKGETIRNSELVELFANQIGLFIERKKAEVELNEKMGELIHFHRLTVGRELTMIELKKEVNELLQRIGEDKKYKIVE